MSKDSTIKTNLYPKIEKSMIKNTNKFRQCVGRFMEARHDDLFDIAPCSRIFFGIEDLKDFFNSIQLSQEEINQSINKAYYFEIKDFNPRAAKDEFTVAVLCIIRYFYLKNKKKELDLSCAYLGFSGKFYPSIHSGSFPVVQPSEYRFIMEYIVNNELSNRYDIKREKSVFRVIVHICNTWINSYSARFKSFTDEDIVYLIQQLHNRIKSFIKNIAELYYDIYNNKDRFFTYDGDSLDADDYHLADNDSLKIERYVEKTMNLLNSNSVNYAMCKMSFDSNVRTDELKSIMEAILDDSKNIATIKELVRIIISVYFQNDKQHDISDIDFIRFSITPKPNTKNKELIRQKQIIETWLEEGSPAYRRRKSREATRNSYYKSVLTYFVLAIYNANK